jgi:hypothetical protein
VLPGIRRSWLPDPIAEGVAITFGEAAGEPEDPGEREGTREAWIVPSGTWRDFVAKELMVTDGLEEAAMDRGTDAWHEVRSASGPT